MLAIACVLLVLLVAGCWFLAGRTLDSFTASSPIVVQMSPPTEEQVAAANEKLARIRGASRDQQSVTVEFTADELNALIARNPSFEDLRGKFRVGIANSILNVNMSVPLHEVPLPGMKRRWFNGSARFGLVYDEDRFSLAVKSLEANGRNINVTKFQPMADWFNAFFNDGFDKSQRHQRESDEFWENVKSIRVEGDKLIITTKGAEPEDDGSTEA